MRVIGLVGNAGVGKDTAAEFLAKDHGWVIAALADRIKQLAHKIFLFDRETLFGPSVNRNRIDARRADTRYWRGVFFRAGQRSEELTALFANAPKPHADPVAGFYLLLNQLEGEPDVFSARRVLQLMGSEWGRGIWKDVWINALRVIVRKIGAGYAYDRLAGLSLDQQAPPPGVVVTDGRFPNEVSAIQIWGGQALWIDANHRVPRDMELAMNQHQSEPTKADFADIVDGEINNDGTLDQLRETMGYLATHDPS